MPVFCQRGFACGETARAVIGPAFWVCRAKSGAAFRCAKPPCAVVRFAAMTSSPRTDVLACPAFALLSHSPTALLNTPALVAVRLHFACAKPRWSVVAPAGGNVLATPFSLPHFRFAQMWPRARTPALPPFRLRTSSFSAHFSAQKCPRRAMLSHSSRRGRPFALFHRAGAAFGTLTAAAAPPPSWSRRPLHIPCPPF